MKHSISLNFFESPELLLTSIIKPNIIEWKIIPSVY